MITLVGLASTLNAQQVAPATEEMHDAIMNYAIANGSKAAALAEYPFIPVGNLKRAKYNITTKLGVPAEDLVHKSELTDSNAIKAQAKKIADKHETLLKEAGYVKAQ